MKPVKFLAEIIVSLRGELARKRSGPSLVLGLYLLVNGIVLYNALFHHPEVGYDGYQHRAYLLTLAEGRLPTPVDTYEYFSPPLPYAPAALLSALGVTDWWAAKSAQLFNWLGSLALTAVHVSIARHLWPDSPENVALALLLLAITPVYYKSFAFIRGEPWVALFTTLIVYEIVVWYTHSPKWSHARHHFGRIGLWLGFALLSRQWAVMLVPALAIFLLMVTRWSWQEDLAHHTRLSFRELILAGSIIGVVALLLSGWFYAHLQQTYGSIAAFNREPRALSWHVQPASFYMGMGNGYLFTDPIRPAFPNQLWPKLYAEQWGDYESYFLVYGQDNRTGDFFPGYTLETIWADGQWPDWFETNRNRINRYLGWLNGLGLLVTSIYLAGIIVGMVVTGRWLLHARPDQHISLSFLWLLTLFSLVGYFLFLLLYPSPNNNGDTIKATYILHIYPALALLGTAFISWLKQRNQFIYRALCVGLLLTLAFSLPAYFTRYTPWQ